MVPVLLSKIMRNIFMVEDNQDIREILDIFLTAEGYNVYPFGTVKEFKKRNPEIIPDLYLFDAMLPDGSGIDLCNEIKNNINNIRTLFSSCLSRKITKNKPVTSRWNPLYFYLPLPPPPPTPVPGLIPPQPLLTVVD